MIKEKLEEDLFDKLPQSGKFVIFGACAVGEKILNDLKIYKPNAKVIGFIDNMIQGTFLGLPVWNLKKFLETANINYDLVVMATRKDFNVINTIFDLYEIPYLPQSNFVSDYYRNRLEVFTEEHFNKILNVLEKEEDKNLYKLLLQTRSNILDTKLREDYYREKYVSKDRGSLTIKNQYLEKINKNAIKTVFDIGMNSGLNVIAYNKLLPNLRKTYGFEVIYDVAKTSYIEDFILNEKLEIIPFALGNKESTTDFYISKTNSGCSFCGDCKDSPTNTANWEKIVVNVTTLDKFCKENQVKPDFIKMDIEGAEMSALQGGIKTIQQCRPQLAISIYHSNSDFINIPLYLNKYLKDYIFRLGHYSPRLSETVLYAIPKELA